MKTIFLLTPFVLWATVCMAQPSFVGATHSMEPSNLTLDRAVELALQRHPELREAEALVEAAKARASQAGLMPNPEAVARVESAPFQGKTVRDAEYVAGISQRIPVGGRLSASRNAAKADVAQAEHQLKVRRIELRRKVQGAFAAALYAREYSIIQSNSVELVNSLLRITRSRVEAGDTVKGEQARLEVELLQTQLEQNRVLIMEERALAALAQVIGRPAKQIVSLSGSLTNALALGEFEQLVLDPKPYLDFAESAVRTQEARLKQAKGERIPDLNLDLFYRRLEASRQDAFDVGISIPLPVFGNYRGKVREAKADLAAARARSDRTRSEITLRMEESQARLRIAIETRKVLREEILPRSERILEAARKRYQEGDITLSELLQRRKDFAGSQTAYLEALRDVAEAGTVVFSSRAF